MGMNMMSSSHAKIRLMVNGGGGQEIFCPSCAKITEDAYKILSSPFGWLANMTGLWGL